MITYLRICAFAHLRIALTLLGLMTFSCRAVVTERTKNDAQRETVNLEMRAGCVRLANLTSCPYSPPAQRNSASAVVFENRRYQVLKPCKEKLGLREFVRARFVQSPAVGRLFFIGR